MLQDNEVAVGFINGILDQKLPPDTDKSIRGQLRNDLLHRLENKLNHAVIAELDDEQLKQLDQLADTKQADKVVGFLQQAGVDLPTVTARVMAEFQAIYLGS